ncbi:metalloprotease [Candidatus Woesearchaeota archaeon CG_4_10_14_0_2_um_filter_57_5]|nr:MAG: hypothetical protein AUJ68_05530 [Candidatus Woesearchaeota archaeon CG1_02_57_44]PIN68265.1 MAG: metalloprotease [Candidatus Woesearchaeota archaeon CG11_big_fil_rev_8_21_14_0_20_57_5]PIZ56873.1 MAG: metalloprotease [Candidatus Woesearchaeota archaeon CG_4_10_14_0_2_um_filter_57_5]
MKQELRDLLVAWVVVSLAFAIAQVGFFSIFSTAGFLIILAFALTVGIGFIGHELAHRVVARRYGCWAEFRADFQMLTLAIIMSFFGFVFAAPGAVYIHGNVDKRRHGHIAAAGPAANILLAALFLLLLQIVPWPVFWLGAYANAFLAVFNMLPFGPFDGAKVLRWGWLPYTGMMVASVILLVMAYS